MSNDTLTGPADRAEPTEARFTTRSLFVAMAVVALLAALVGPLVRRLEPAEQLRLLTAWAVWLAATMLLIAYQARRRYQAERLAGATLLQLPMFHETIASTTPARWWFHLFCCGIGSLLALSFVTPAVLAPAINRDWSFVLFHFGLYGFASIWCAARAVTLFWWRSAIRFCEYGILWDGRLVRWGYIIQYRWSDSARVVLEINGIDQRNIEIAWKVPVSPERNEAVQSLLEEKMPALLPAPGGPSLLELGHIPLSTAVKSPHFPRYLVGTLVRIPAFIALFVIIARNPTGVREFDGLIFPGFLIGAILPWARRKFLNQDAGPPLVRLSGRRGWLRLIAFAAVAVLLFKAGSYLGSANWILSEWLFGVLGLACGGSIAGALISSYSKHIDLRASGVSLPGELFWPWERIRIIRWDQEQSGRLILARGWQRVAATVPREQRAAVDRILSEKLSA